MSKPETPSDAFAIDCCPELEEMLVLAKVLFTITGIERSCDGLGVVVVATILLGVVVGVVVVLAMLAAVVVVATVECVCVHMYMQTNVRECNTVSQHAVVGLECVECC